MKYPVTPDGRYFVVKGKLWRATNPNLSESERNTYVKNLMDARRAVKQAKADDDEARLKAARERVNKAKIALGERGPVWWSDNQKDFNRYLIKNTPYKSWYDSLNDNPC